MSLILAIEPNKNQAQQLSVLVRTHLKAELVTAPTAAAALAALGDRIPDIVLTPALLSLRDETALTERLRDFGSAGSHVHTLAIPILAAGPPRGSSPGLLGRRKDKGDVEVGCDPAVFAEQIQIYLQRAGVERRAQASEAAARAMAAPPAPAEPLPGIEDLSFTMDADEFAIDSLELPAIPPPESPVPELTEPESLSVARAAAELTPEDLTVALQASVAGALPDFIVPPAPEPTPQAATESFEEFYELSVEELSPAPAVATPETIAVPIAAPPAPIAATLPSIVVPSAPIAGATRPRRSPPSPDDWTYFNPSQPAFRSLIRRLDEIAGSAA